MVKGNTRQVIVVKSPDPNLFEQAIFLLQDDAMNGISEQDLLKEACRAADRYSYKKPPRPRQHQFIWAFAGAACVAIAWICSALIF